MQMEESVVGWLYKTAWENHWRVASWYDIDDMVQDGYLHYVRLRQKYPDVKKPAHLMGMFKRFYLNHLHDLSKQRTRAPSELLECDLLAAASNRGEVGAALLWEALCGCDSDTPMWELLSSAPTTVQQVLRLFADDKMLKKLRAPYRRRKTGRETTNERLCRLTGYDPKQVDLPALLRQYAASL